MNEQIKNVAAKFNMTEEEAAKVVAAVPLDELHNIEGQLFEMMFNHYCDNGEMPYEEATNGDAYAWIGERLQKEFNIYA